MLYSVSLTASTAMSGGFFRNLMCQEAHNIIIICMLEENISYYVYI